MAGIAGVRSMAPLTSTRIAARLKRAQEHSSPLGEHDLGLPTTRESFFFVGLVSMFGALLVFFALPEPTVCPTKEKTDRLEVHSSRSFTQVSQKSPRPRTCLDFHRSLLKQTLLRHSMYYKR